MLVERYAGGIDEIVGAMLLAISGCGLRTPLGLGEVSAIAGNGIGRDAQHLAMENAIARVVECVDFDRGVLSSVHEPDVVIGQGRLDLEMAILRDHDGEHLGGGDDASYRMYSELLDDAV